MILTMVAKMFLLVSVLNMMSYIQKVSSFKATVLMPPIATTTNFMSGGFYEGPKKTPPATTSLAAPPRSARTKFAGSGFYQGPAETPLTVSVIVAQSKFAGSGFYMGPKDPTTRPVATLYQPPTTTTTTTTTTKRAADSGGFYMGPKKSTAPPPTTPLSQPPATTATTATLPVVVTTTKIAFSGFYTGPKKR